MIFAWIAIVIFIIIVVIIAIQRDNSDGNQPYIFEAPEKTAGRQGEAIAASAIRQVLREDDFLFTNVTISFDGKPAEMDNVIVNKYGVFIIEVKNYKGLLVGDEDDYEWEKYKSDGYGNTFLKTVKNPIKQVKRQVYVLAKYLQYYGADVWVEGYTLFVQGNSPVESGRVLKSVADIDRVMHTVTRKRLDAKTVTAVKKILGD